MNLLLIEDHADIAANITEFFEGRGDAVEHVVDGAAGLQKALADPYDAIVLDLLLPGLDGLSLCRQLRHAGRTQVPVLMLTAKDLLADKIEGFEAGADDYLVKPFSLAELDARLKALVRRARLPETPRILSVGDLRFDLDTLEAERGGERVKLNPTTRRLLIVLLQNSHRVVTRAGARARAVGRLAAAGRLPARPHARAAHGHRQELPSQAPAHDPWHRLSTFGRTGTFVG